MSITSSDDRTFHIPFFKRKQHGGRAFCFPAVQVWNSLPFVSVTALPSLLSKLALKHTSSNIILTCNSFSAAQISLSVCLSLSLFLSVSLSLCRSPCLQISLYPHPHPHAPCPSQLCVYVCVCVCVCVCVHVCVPVCMCFLLALCV